MTREDFIAAIIGLLLESYAERRAPEMLGQDAEKDYAFIGRRMQGQVRRVHSIADQLFPPNPTPSRLNGTAALPRKEPVK